MKEASRIPALALSVIVGIGTAATQVQSTSIRGTLRERGKPIVEAGVFLHSFEDEHYAKIFAGRKADRKAEQKLEVCMHDVSTSYPDAQGHYEFSGLKPGWYAVHFLWNISEKSRPSQSLFKEGHWGVMYAGRKDSTGKYDTMAQDIPFYHSGKSDTARDFDTQH